MHPFSVGHTRKCSTDRLDLSSVVQCGSKTAGETDTSPVQFQRKGSATMTSLMTEFVVCRVARSFTNAGVWRRPMVKLSDIIMVPKSHGNSETVRA